MSVVDTKYVPYKHKVWKANFSIYRNHDLPASVTPYGNIWFGFKRLYNLPDCLFSGEKIWTRTKNNRYGIFNERKLLHTGERMNFKIE